MGFTVIEMVLEIKKELVDKWYSSGKKENKLLEDLELRSYLERFSDQIEQFILNEMINFSHPLESLSIENLNNGISNLICRLKNTHFITFTLITDSKTLLWSENEELKNGKTVKEQMEKKNYIKEWSEITFKAENLEEGNHRIICIPDNRKALRLIQESPVNIEFNNNRIHIYWLGVLELENN